MEREEKLKALDAAIAKLEKEYGKGAVMKLGDPASQMNVETIPTGSLAWILHWDWAESLRDVSSRSTDRNPVVRRQLPCI